MELTGWYCRDQDVTTPCVLSRMELTGWYCRDQDVTKPCVLLLHVWSLDGTRDQGTMCLTTRMELTGWYYRNVTKPCVLLHVWS